MANEQKPEESEQINGGSDATGTGIVERLEAKYRAVREDIKTYPDVWASYTIVYGTLGLYLAYKWRKLRKTDDRIRALQEELRARYQAEESSASAAASSENVATSARAGSTSAAPSEKASTSARAGSTSAAPSEKASTSARASSTSATPPDNSSSSANVGKTPK